MKFCQRYKFFDSKTIKYSPTSRTVNIMKWHCNESGILQR